MTTRAPVVLKNGYFERNHAFVTIPFFPDNESASALQSENLGRNRGSWAASTWNGDLVLFFDNFLSDYLLGPSQIFHFGHSLGLCLGIFLFCLLGFFYWDFFIWTCYWDFLICTFYGKILLGLFMNTFLLGLFLLWHLYWTYYQYYF